MLLHSAGSEDALQLLAYCGSEGARRKRGYLGHCVLQPIVKTTGAIG